MNTRDQEPTRPPAVVTFKCEDIAQEARLWRRSGLRGLVVQVGVLGFSGLLYKLLPAGPVNDAVVGGTILVTAFLGAAVAFSMGYADALTTKLKPRRRGPSAP